MALSTSTLFMTAAAGRDAKCLMAKCFAGVNRIGLAHVRQIFFCRIAAQRANGAEPLAELI